MFSEQRFGGAREPVSTVNSPRHTSESQASPMGPLAALAPEDLLAHSEWLKGFARALVWEEAEAEDLAQEAMGVLAASTQKVRDLRAYLKGTVRHLALKNRRQAVRRRDREALLGREEPPEVPAVSEITERMDLMRAVLEEVGHLPKAQARVIGLRYLEGLQVAEIADRDGVQPSSVRSSLARGLERLRTRLDGRFDGRSAWCAVLAPWSLSSPFPGDATGDAGIGETSAQGVLTNAAPKGATALAPAAALGLAMSLKPAFIIAATLVAGMGAWRALTAPGVDLPPFPSPNLAAASSQGAAQLEGVEGELPLSLPEASPRTRAATSAAEQSKVQVARSAKSNTTLQGVFVDALTSEPIPELAVRFGYVENGKPRRTEFVRSDALGRFGSEDQVVPSRGLSISVVDGLANASKVLASDFEIPADGRVPIEVGPTFKLQPMGVPASAVLARNFKVLVSGPGIRANDPEDTEYRPSKRDWIRFGRPFGDADDAGRWVMELKSTDGQLVGTAEVQRRLGIEPAPVAVAMEPRGALQFTLDSAGAPNPDFCTVEVESDSLDQPISVDLVEEEGSMTGQLRFLEPALYRWSVTRGTQKESGEVQLRVLTEEQVTVRLPAAGSWQPRVIVDASGAPDVDVTEWPAQFLRLDGSNKFFESKVERIGGPASGQFEARMDSLPAGDWSFAVMAPPGFIADPMLVSVKRGGEAPVMRIRIAQKVDVQLTFVHAKTGKPLQPTTVSHFDGVKAERVEVSKEGLAEFRPPATHATYFIAHLDGYQMAKVPFESGVHPTEIEVALEPGWSHRVFVLSVPDGAVEGVGFLLDGKSIGKTDTNGEIWLEGDGPPDLIELDEESKERLSVLVSSFSEGGISGEPGDPHGYMFLVAPK